VTVEREWERLVDQLNEWAEARSSPQGIEVTIEQSTGVARTVELVVTPDEWSGFWGVIWGDEDSAAAGLRRQLLEGVPPDMPFLVYDNEQWVASATREFPPDPDGDFQPEPGGGWGHHRSRGQRDEPVRGLNRQRVEPPASTHHMPSGALEPMSGRLLRSPLRIVRPLLGGVHDQVTDWILHRVVGVHVVWMQLREHDLDLCIRSGSRCGMA